MTDWRDAALAFAGCDAVRGLAGASAPAWVWSQDGERLLWCNPSGGALLGAARFAELADRRWSAQDPLRRDLHNLGRSLGDAPSMARLRVAPGIDRLPMTCRVRRMRTAGLRGLLVESLTPLPGSFPDPAAFLSPRLEAESATAREVAPALPVHPDVASSAAVPETPAPREPDVAVAAAEPTEPEVAATTPPAAPPSIAGANDDRAADSWEKIAEELPDWVRTGFAVPNGESGGSKAPEPDAPPVRDLRLVPPSAAMPPATLVPPPPERSVSAGRVERELSRKPVRFLWQTDASDRFLFVSPGLGQVVGRNAEIVGERWIDVAARLGLDPSGRIAAALVQRDTWSGLTAWWPIEGSGVRVPAELTALPVFGGDHSFQGYRGFGVMRPAEALMPAAFETRYRPDAPPAAPVSAEEPAASPPANVVPIRADIERVQDLTRLSPQERIAFEEIAASLRERIGEVLPPGTERGDRDAGAAPPVTEVPAVPAAAPPVTAAADAVGTRAGEPPPDQQGAIAPAEASDAPAESPSQPELSLPPPEPPAPVAGAQDRVEPGPVRPTPTPVADTARRQSEDVDLQRRLEEMTAILDTATDGILILDATGTIENANASAEALFGMDAAELHGMLFVDLLTEESRIAALDYLGGLKDHGVASLLNEGREVEAKAGARAMPLFMTLGRISSDNGGRYCALLRDMTHWKRTEADLVAARRKAESASSQKSDFLARVSHEIRTPMNAVIGFAEVMIEERFGAIGNDRYREYLRDIRISGEHVVSLVNDLLDISKIEAGKLDLSFVAVPLNELVRECITLMQPQASRGQVVLRSSLSREVPGIVADERTMRQIVLNLLSNSVKFTAPGGQVIASTSLAESGEAILRVRDTGEGMSAEELVRALEPFRQISTSTMGSNRTGTGLGLPLTKALVEANRASFEIRSAPGEGTVVKVTFPPTRVLSE